MPADYTDNKLSRLWDTISTAAAKALESGWKELIRSSKIGRCRVEISAINSRIEAHFKELGREYYSLRQANVVSLPQLEDIVRQIKELEEKIGERQDQIEFVVQEREAEINLESPPAEGTVVKNPGDPAPDNQVNDIKGIKQNKSNNGLKILAVKPIRVTED